MGAFLWNIKPHTTLHSTSTSKALGSKPKLCSFFSFRQIESVGSLSIKLYNNNLRNYYMLVLILKVMKSTIEHGCTASKQFNHCRIRALHMCLTFNIDSNFNFNSLMYKKDYRQNKLLFTRFDVRHISEISVQLNCIWQLDIKWRRIPGFKSILIWNKSLIVDSLTNDQIKAKWYGRVWDGIGERARKINRAEKSDATIDANVNQKWED